AFLGASTINDKGYVTYDFKTKDPGAYVFGSISYAMVDTKQKDAATAKAVKELLTYFLDPKCPNSAPELEYTSITGKFRDANLALIAKITA
ncbi:MAG: hypothetical protein RLY39_944, partial [Actinomycetota bacterium]